MQPRQVAVLTSERRKPAYALVLANRCPVCNLPKHLHVRNKDGDICVKFDMPNRIEYPDKCMPNPIAARKIVGLAGGEANYSRGAFAKRICEGLVPRTVG